MSALSHFLVIASYGVLAALFGLVLPQSVPEVDPITSYVIAGCTFLAAALMHEILTRRRNVAVLLRNMQNAWGSQADEVALLRQVNKELVGDLSEARQEVGNLRGMIEQGVDVSSQAVVAEMRVLQAQLSRLGGGVDQTVPPPKRLPNLSPAPPLKIAGTPPDADHVLAIIQSALESNRVDLYLQPVVSLPQRKVRFYEALSRIRTEDGDLMLPEQYLEIAAERGLIATIDNLLLFRCVQLLRRQKRRKRDLGFFVPISSATLADEVFLTDFVQFLEANKELAPNLIFELSQKDFLAQEKHVVDCIERMAKFDYRFSIDQITRLDLDFEVLSRQQVMFLKVDASLLLSDGRKSGAQLNPADFKERLQRNKIDMVVGRIEEESTVVELLDSNVDYGQGYLFGEPRPVRDS